MYVRFMELTIRVEDALDEAHARECAALRRQLALIADLDRREAYLVDGAVSMADWVAYKYGWAETNARRRLRAALALEYLPAIAEAFESGLLPWDKVRWLIEFATPVEDAIWANDAVGMSAAEVRSIALHRRRLAKETADRRFRRRYLRMRVNEEEGEFRFWGRLSDTEGAVVKKALERIADRAPVDAETGLFEPYERRCADALVELASLRLGADADPDRATVVVHVDEPVLASEDGVGTLEGGIPIAAETVRRLTCDARLQTVTHGTDGQVSDVGRVTRTVPSSLRRTLVARDGGCAYEGCSNKRWLHAHHIRHFARGGPDDRGQPRDALRIPSPIGA
jgi:hypothetical protein